jgi:hypothetical protein
MTEGDRERRDQPPAAGLTTSTPAESDEAGTIRDLLRGAATRDAPPEVDVLHSVQRKIRQRSRGRYFADGWSTTRQPPVSTYLVTSLVMLVIVVLVYLVLSPLAGTPTQVEPPAPVNVVPPQGPR